MEISCISGAILHKICTSRYKKIIKTSMIKANSWHKCRRSNTGFGIWDLPQKSSTKAKFGTLGLNWDFFGTIFISFWDCYTVLHLRVRNLGLACKIGTFLGPNLDFGPIWDQVPNLGLHWSACKWKHISPNRVGRRGYQVPMGVCSL